MRFRSRLALAGAAALAVPAITKGQIIAAYNFGPNNTSFTYAATTLNSNVTASGINSTSDFGSNDTLTPDSGVGGTSGWYTNNPGGNYLSVESSGSTTDNGFWIEMIVTANAGYVIDPTSFELYGGAGGSSAVRSAYIYDNVDGYPTNIATNNSGAPTFTNGDQLASGTFTAVRGSAGPPAMNEIQVGSFPSDDVDLTGFTVRVYFDTEGNVQKNIDVGDLELDGSVVAAPPSGQSIWITNGSGNYNTGGNWANGIPNGIGNEAEFLNAITSNQVVYTTTSITLGSIIFNNSNASYALTGAVGANLTLQTSSGSALVDVQNGTHEINLPLILASNTTFQTDNSTASLVIANPVTINSGVSLTTTGNGTVTFNSIITVQSNASVDIADSTHANTLSLATNATATVAAPVLEVDNLSNLGTLNLENNEVIINYGSGADPISSIAAEIKSGYAGGSWTGAGITSTNAQTNSSYGIGYADAADLGNPAGLASGQIEIKYTLLGDANLDGKVNGSDFTLMAANFNDSVTNGWDKGDFNYSGTVNGDDFVLLAENFNQFASQSSVDAADLAALNAFAAANGISLTSVPEPASLGLLVVATIGVLGRRRRASVKNNQ